MVNFQKKTQYWLGFVLLLFGLAVTFPFNNCAPVQFDKNMGLYSKEEFGSSFRTNEDTQLTGKLNADKILADMGMSSATVSFKVINDPLNGIIENFNPESGDFTYTPTLNFFGGDRVQYEILIKETPEAAPIIISQSANISVTAVNDSPQIQNGTVSITENGSAEIAITATDVDDSALSYTINSFSQGSTAPIKSKNIFTYLPKCGFRGTETATIQVADKAGATASGVFTFTVNADSGTLILSRSTPEDTPYNDSLASTVSRCITADGTTTITANANPTRGALSNISNSSLSYTYRPNLNLNGLDSFSLRMTKGTLVKIVQINMTVTAVNDLPSLTKNSYDVYRNGRLTFDVETSDPDDSTVNLQLSAAKPVSIPTPRGGVLEYLGGKSLRYTTPPGVSDVTDTVTIYLVDSSNVPVAVQINFKIIYNPIAQLKPAMAVRGVSCTICHARIGASLITDLGAGDSFTQNRIYDTQRAATVIDSTKTTDIFSNGGSPVFTRLEAENIEVWRTAKIDQNFYVKSGQDTYFKNLTSKLYGIYVEPLGSDFPGYESLEGGSLAGTSILPDGANQLGNIQSLNEIYIGAPTAGDITSAMANPASNFEVKGTIQGLTVASGASKIYLTNNSSTISCEGDVLVTKTLLLNNVTISTLNGCRIYSTAPIFVQNNLTITSPTGNMTLSNLQLSSSSSILMGMGMSAIACRKDSGCSEHNLMKTRQDTQGTNILNTIATEAANLGSVLQDATQHANRNISFSRLLLNAPQIHSRYKGNFSGVIIAEIALMSPGSFTYSFNDVFSNNSLEILPLLNGNKVLVAK